MKLIKYAGVVFTTISAMAFAANESSVQNKQYLPKAARNESAVLSQYTGVEGTAPKHVTISTAGAAFELYPNATNYYAYFAQTLASGIYYELRAYTRYNYMAANPLVTVPDSNISNPMGYGGSLFVGYNFHVNQYLDVLPYVRFNNFYDMVAVFADSNGDHYNSQTYSYIFGTKFALRASPIFSPYINLFGGYQQSGLSGSYPSLNKNQQITGTLDQILFTYEFGLAAKVSEHMSFVPYYQYITIANYPDSMGLTKVANGGFGMSDLTGTTQVLGLKLNVAW